MGRHTINYAPARALLSSPYPLPNFIRRPDPPPEVLEAQRRLREEAEAANAARLAAGQIIQPCPQPDPAEGPVDPIAQAAAAQGLPYDPNWRDRPPAIPPIPYAPKTPEEQAQADRRKAIRKQVKRIRRMLATGRGWQIPAELMGGDQDEPMEDGEEYFIAGPSVSIRAPSDIR